jgi:hypothetical protein
MTSYPGAKEGNPAAKKANCRATEARTGAMVGHLKPKRLAIELQRLALVLGRGTLEPRRLTVELRRLTIEPCRGTLQPRRLIIEL